MVRAGRRGARRAGCSLALLAVSAVGEAALAQQPSVVDSGLAIQTLAPAGLLQPTGMRFIGPDDFFVIEKASGKVKRVHGGAVDEVLDLSVASDSERGLLGIELHPDFASNGFVYLYHSLRSLPGDGSGTTSWTGNQLDRWVWNGAQLVADPTFHAFTLPRDPAQANGPNHDGGVLRFGPDGKLYLTTGDLNRSRIEQNNAAASLAAGTGGIYRLEADGTLPADGPYAAHSDAALRGLHAYGVRNSFGMAFDPRTQRLWDTENGPERMDEINLVDAGMNSGWTILMGPEARDPEGQGRQDLVDLALASTYSDPEFSFAVPIGITSIGFLAGSALGTGYDDAVLVGANNTGLLYLLRLNAARDGFVLSGALADLVADGLETALIAFGQGFGVVTGIETGPDGALYVLSLGRGAVYRIAPVPEPTSAGLLGVGLLAIARLARRRRVARLAATR
jgi:glucose/arabinose dehydrogenase